LAELEAALWPESRYEPPAPADWIAILRPYIEAELASGTRLHSLSRHLLGLYAHRPGARSFRRVLSEFATRPGVGFEVLAAAVKAAEGSGGTVTDLSG